MRVVQNSRVLCMCFAATTALWAQNVCPPQSVTPEQVPQRINELNFTAQAALQQKQFAMAIRYFSEAVCLAPDNAQELYGLGVAQAGSGDFLSARKALTAAARLQFANPLPLAMLVRVNLSMGDRDNAKAALRQVATQFSDNSELHALLSRLLAENNEPDLALAESLRAHASRNADPEATIELAVLENSAGAYEDSVKSALGIVEQEGLAASARAAAAGITALGYESLGQRDRAVEYLRRSIAFDPHRENSYISLAFLYEKSNDFQHAVEVLEAGRRALPNSNAMLLPLGINLIRVSRNDASICVLLQVIQTSPDEIEAYIHLADGYHQVGQLEKEVEALQMLAKRKPQYPMIHLLIARAMMNLPSPANDAVLLELQQAENNSPSDSEIFYLRGKVSVTAKRYDDAIAAFRRSIELQPNDSRKS
jgi:tetratricopeptide (TPR) repeat protein